MFEVSTSVSTSVSNSSLILSLHSSFVLILYYSFIFSTLPQTSVRSVCVISDECSVCVFCVRVRCEHVPAAYSKSDHPTTLARRPLLGFRIPPRSSAEQVR